MNFPNMRRALLLLVLSSASTAQAAVISSVFTANVNGFNPGPYSGGDAISVSLQWDNAITRDWGTSNSSYFQTAVDNIVITVDGHVITGTDAQVVQSFNTTDNQIGITFGTYLGNSYGTVSSAPDFNGQSFEALRIVLRDASSGLFSSGLDTQTLISGPSPNLYVDSLTLYFTGSDVLNPLNRSFTMSGAQTNVPAPVPLALLAPLLLFVGRRAVH
ncbi:MAG: hypothetical protein KDI42_09455 [Gammaproteobacteria bacterium]|nr:hypothetical protein [Gammaproteobacteria bacterium]